MIPSVILLLLFKISRYFIVFNICDFAGDVYTGSINVTARGDPCDSWSQQSVITLEEELDHNFCRYEY